MKVQINEQYLLQTAQTLLSIDSPSGFCDSVMAKVEEIVQALGYPMERNQKGNGIITIQGEEEGNVVGLAAHVDTLGLMVRSISPSGTLRMTKIGGPITPTLDGEYCTIYTRDGRTYTGTILSTSPAAHVHTDSGTVARDLDHMEVRIDEEVHSKEEVEKLGIRPGDYICYDPKTVVTSSGFLKSRFIDDKASVAILIALLKLWKETGFKPKHTVKMIISTYEEVGHGSSAIPTDIERFIAVDMGCIGLDLSCTEYDVSICAKDSSGPYDYNMTSRLIALAEANELPFAVDIYPQYSSDASAAQRGGNDIRAALIGPGVHASHGMERTHKKALVATAQLLHAYLAE
ncbi:MAG: M42 family metallopeptidase [Bacilli bacterium]